MTYDIREAASLDPDRPVILICTDSALLPTGLARVVRGIFKPIFERGEFQIVQHGWFHVEQGNAQTVQVPWKIIPVRRNESNPRFFKIEDKIGQESFNSLVENLKPDIVFTVTDYDRIEHLVRSPHRSTYGLVAYLPLDVTPPTVRWSEVIKQPDCTVYYTKFAQRWGEACDTPGDTIPHGVDTSVYRPAPRAQREALRKKFFGVEPGSDTVIVTSIGRNQNRKRHDLLIEAIARLRKGGYSTCEHCHRLTMHAYMLPGAVFAEPDNVCDKCQTEGSLVPGKLWESLTLYLHTDPDEPGTDALPIRQLIALWNIDDHVRLNPSIDLRIGQGLSEDMLASFYHCTDIYAHPSNSGGWELPPHEAAACGIPIVAVNAHAQNEWMETLPGCQLTSGDPWYDRTGAGYRIQGHMDEFVRGLLHYLEAGPEVREQDGRANAEWAKDYTWEDISKRWENEIFQKMLDPNRKSERWRVLVEV
jgi:glycosyltransferase involved in cell wall biosynthesis